MDKYGGLIEGRLVVVNVYTNLIILSNRNSRSEK